MISFKKLYLLGDNSDNDGSESGSAGTCNFPFRFEESVGRFDNSVSRVDDSVGCVCGVVSGVFFRLESIQFVTLFCQSCLYQ